MKSIDDFVLPQNLNVILDQDGIWSDDTFDPITIYVIEAEVEEEEITCFQLELAAGDSFPEIEALMEAHGLEITGYDWEDMIREYIHGLDPFFENTIESDSEGATCVLYVRDPASFKRLLGHVLDLVQSPTTVKRLIG